MEYRKMIINKQEKDVSLLGFGCMRFPTLEDGEVDIQQVKEMIHYALDHGVNYIDTAWPYHGGKSELIIKEVLKDVPRETYYLADKIPLWECETMEDVEKIFYAQLEKTGVDYFDFYLIHAVNESRMKQIKSLKLLPKLEEFRAQGKIKNLGFSFHDSLPVFKKMVDLYDWDFCQIQLNYMDVHHQQGKRGYDILAEKGIPVIVMEPVKGGSLAHFSDDIEHMFKSIKPNVSVASWAFRWVGSLPNVKVILSGMSNFEQVKDNIKTFSHFEPLDDKEQKLIVKVRKAIKDKRMVACTACRYCMPCEHGVDIPSNFITFNYHAMYQNDDHTKWMMRNLKEHEAFADACIGCEECISKCPQHIDIPRELENFRAYVLKNNL